MAFTLQLLQIPIINECPNSYEWPKFIKNIPSILLLLFCFNLYIPCFFFCFFPSCCLALTLFDSWVPSHSLYVLSCYCDISKISGTNIFNRPGVAGAVLQSHPSLIDWLSHPLVKISSKHFQSQTRRARELKFWKNVYPTICVTCHVSHVTCHLPRVTCQMSKTKVDIFLRKRRKKNKNIYIYIYEVFSSSKTSWTMWWSSSSP